MPLTCPTCHAPADHHVGVVSTPYEVGNLNRGAAHATSIERVSRPEGFVSCSRCEWAATVADILKRVR